MRRQRSSRHAAYLVPKSRLNLKPITLRLPAALLDELAALKARADQVGFVLDVQCAVTDALERTALEVAESLERLENGTPLAETSGLVGHSGRRGPRKKDHVEAAETANSAS